MTPLEVLALTAPILMVLVVIGGGSFAIWLDERAERRKTPR
jgi:hypothetical protein